MSKFLFIIYKKLNKSEKSFEDIDLWIKDLRSNSSPDIKLFLIGNKADLDEKRVIKTEQGIQMKKDYGFDIFMETSAKTGFNAQELLVEAGKILYDEYIKYKKSPAIGGERLVKKKI